MSYTDWENGTGITDTKTLQEDGVGNCCSDERSRLCSY